MKKNIKKMNPWLFSYLSFAMFCCVVISAVFLNINFENNKNKELIRIKEKLELVADDLDKQMEIFRKIGIEITINNYYKPFYFTRNKYYEKKLLEELAQYSNYSPLENEYFLHYHGDENIFCSNKTTTMLTTYIENLNVTNQEYSDVVSILEKTDKMRVYSLEKNILIFYPLSISSREYDATLCVVFSKDALMERIQTVSGGLDGNMKIYCGNVLVYESEEKTFDMLEKDVLSTEGMLGELAVYYIPVNTTYITQGLLPLQIMSVLAVVILILFTASFFAWRSYKPIVLLMKKFRISFNKESEEYFANVLEEINYMFEMLIGSNKEAITLLEQKQNQVRNQLLILLLEGKYAFDIQQYLNQAHLIFPGPWYFVVSILFKEEMVETEILEKIRELLETTTNLAEKIYVYAITNTESRTISCLCSISDKMQCEEVCKDINDLAESYGNNPQTGAGNIYQSLNNLSASYLESLDNMYKNDKIPKMEEGKKFWAANMEDELFRLSNALRSGETTVAHNVLNEYVVLIEKEASVLIQQYFFTNFYMEISKVYSEFHINLPTQYISLSVSTKNVSQFIFIAEKMIDDFLAKITKEQERVCNEESYRIYQYVNENFMNYETTIENVAQLMNTNIISVRNAIKKHSGKSYKEYLIYLRMEYAKELLVKHNMTVAETCSKVGYSNISYFIKAFKSHTGVTPAIYKNGECQKEE